MNLGPGRDEAHLARRAATFAVGALLVALLAQRLGSPVQQALLRLGERTWPGYGFELRLDPGPPPRPPEPSAAAGSAGGGASASAATKSAEECAVLEAMGERDPGCPEVAGAGAPAEGAASGGEVRGGAAAAGAGDAAPGEAEAGAEKVGAATGSAEAAGLSDEERVLLALAAEDPGGGAGVAAPQADTAAREAEATRRYQEALAEHASRVERRTPEVIRFAAIEGGVARAVGWLGDHLPHLFVLLVGLCGAVATATRHHIALRQVRSARDDRVAQGVSLAANLLLLGSVAAQWRLRQEVGSDDGGLAILWGLGFGAMIALNVAGLWRPRAQAGAASGGLGHALLCAPLYAVMAVLAGAYFLAIEGYAAGLAVYLDKLMQNAQLYLQVGLYVWAGMLLKQTRVAPQVFAALRPWRLSPEILAVVLVLLAAVPTAYSGASGIFVIAAGALVFRELRQAGARPGLALASTAMSGSLGVVLSPCLLVVIIGYLTGIPSDQLFGWGRSVFLLSGALLAGIVLATRTSPLWRAPEAGAGGASLRALGGIVPHALVMVGLLMAYQMAFEAGLDQHSAPALLPIALLMMLGWERLGRRRGGGAEARAAAGSAGAATAESSVHIGALLLLMALSAGIGGVIERADVVAWVPAEFGSPVAAMGVLVVALVLIGMVMDPYGAVLLVHVSLARIAQGAGIDPVHFWMVVLCAFELGYLTPPVALNHLLARQVVGDEAEAGAAATGSFWRRHERYLLPIAVMVTTLLVVAFGPLVWGA